MAMTALFNACNNDDSTPLNEETVPVSFTIGGIDSRATTNTDYTTLFDNNDQIGISATNLTPAMNNVLYTVTVANSTTSIATTIGDYAYGAENAVFNAYYPYSENFNNTFSVQTDQTSGIGASDFLTATATGSKGNATVTLNFSHRLVLVEVNLTGVSNVSSVKLKNAKTEVTYTASTDGTTEPAVNTPDNSTKSDIIMNPVTASSKYWAIIPAQEIAAGNLFEVTTSDGKTYLYTTTSASTFTAKKLVKYSLTLAEEAVLAQYNPVTIVAWDTQNLTQIEGNLEEKKFSLTNIYSNNTNFTSGSVTTYNQTPAWFYQSSSASIITETINENEVTVIKIKAASELGSWYNNGIAYCAGSENLLSPLNTYKLSFYAKASTSTELKVWCGNKQDGTNAYIYKIKDVDGATLKTLNLTNDWTLYEVSFDPSKTYTAASTGKSLTENNTNMPFNITFWPGGVSTTDPQAELNYFIHSITFEQN